MQHDLVTLTLPTDATTHLTRLPGIQEHLRITPDELGWADSQAQCDHRDSMMPEHHTAALAVLARERPQGRALYVACGFGLGPALLRAQGYDVHAIDIRATYVQLLRRHGLDVTLADARAPITSGPYDITISRDFLRDDYLSPEDILDSLHAQHAALAPNGILVHASLLVNFENSTQLPGMLDPALIDATPFRSARTYRVVQEGFARGVQVLRT